MKPLLVPVAAMLLLSTGCASTGGDRAESEREREDPAEVVETTVTEPDAQTEAEESASAADSTAVGEVADVEELLEAYTAAGFDCDWQVNVPTGAAVEEGHCSEGGAEILAVYPSVDVTQEVVANSIESFEGMGIQINYVVGPNWLINTDSPDEVAAALGGDVVKINVD